MRLDKRCMGIQNYFHGGLKDMWSICFREYDSQGNLIELVGCKSTKIKSKFRMIRSFMAACKPGNVREVQFCRNGKQYPSLVTNGIEMKYAKPITAMLPLFDYARLLNIEV